MFSNKTVINNILWRFLERCGAQGVTFVVSVVLARLLDPDVYGTVALVTVFTSILQVFVDSGMGNALIQKKEADDLDFSSVFFFNLFACTILYCVMFFLAPMIAEFYHRQELIPVVRVLSITLIISGIKNIQQAFVSRNLLFKKFFFATLGGTIGAAFIGIIMAYHGYGVWAIVAQYLFNGVIDTVILWATVKWRPKLLFSLERLKGLFSYGWKLLVSSLLDTGYNNLRSLVIGRRYSPSDLAYYHRGNTFPSMVVSNINSSIDSVLLPTLSKEQDDRKRVRDMTRRAIKTSTYIMMPLMVGMAVCAEPLIRILLTEKWLPCVFFLRVYCFTYSFWPIHTANLNALKALGRSDLFLRLEIIKKIVGMVALISTMLISVKAMALSSVFVSIASQIINSWPNRTLLDYHYIDQIKDMLPQIFISCSMGLIVYLVNYLMLPDMITLLVQVPLGTIVYFILSKVTRVDSYDYVVTMVKGYLKRIPVK